MDIVEKVARVLCFKNGMDPDLSLGGDQQNFLWMEYEGQAEFAIEAVREHILSIKNELISATENTAPEHAFNSIVNGAFKAQ